jgi:hypothetical protein
MINYYLLDIKLTINDLLAQSIAPLPSALMGPNMVQSSCVIDNGALEW